MGWRLVPFKGPFFIEKWSGRELEFAKSLFLRRLSRQTGRQVQNQFQSPRKLGYLCMHPAIGSGSSTVEPFLPLQQVVNAIFLRKIAASFNFCESNEAMTQMIRNILIFLFLRLLIYGHFRLVSCKDPDSALPFTLRG